MLKRRSISRLGLIFVFAVPLVGQSTREISGKSAPEIAEVAKACGQNDNITFSTVRRNP